jgi:NAD(P)-dependent dehydrogenase (short-subunit alcohol dehydrogenase family)
MPTKMKRIAVVTGGGSGIGAAVAQALAKDGWIVVLAGRRKEALEGVVAGGSGLTGVLARFPKTSPMRPVCGACSRPRCSATAESTSCSTTRVSEAPSVHIGALELEVWNKVLAVNLTGAFLCTREAFRVTLRLAYAGRFDKGAPP